MYRYPNQMSTPSNGQTPLDGAQPRNRRSPNGQQALTNSLTAQQGGQPAQQPGALPAQGGGASPGGVQSATRPQEAQAPQYSLWEGGAAPPQEKGGGGPLVAGTDPSAPSPQSIEQHPWMATWPQHVQPAAPVQPVDNFDPSATGGGLVASDPALGAGGMVQGGQPQGGFWQGFHNGGASMYHPAQTGGLQGLATRLTQQAAQSAIPNTAGLIEQQKQQLSGQMQSQLDAARMDAARRGTLNSGSLGAQEEQIRNNYGTNLGNATTTLQAQGQQQGFDNQSGLAALAQSLAGSQNGLGIQNYQTQLAGQGQIFNQNLATAQAQQQAQQQYLQYLLSLLG